MKVNSKQVNKKFLCFKDNKTGSWNSIPFKFPICSLQNSASWKGDLLSNINPKTHWKAKETGSGPASENISQNHAGKLLNKWSAIADSRTMLSIWPRQSLFLSNPTPKLGYTSKKLGTSLLHYYTWRSLKGLVLPPRVKTTFIETSLNFMTF